MIKRLFTNGTTSVVSAAVIVAAFSMLSRFVGFIRDRVLSGLFGAGDELDIYYTAFRVPDFLFQLVVIGALSASFIPFFTKYFGKDDDKAWRYTNNMLNGLLVAFLFIAGIGIAAAPLYTPLIAFGFSPEKQWEVVASSRVLFLGQAFFALSMVFGSVLQGAKRFLLYSFAPIVNNVGILIGALVFVPTLGTIGLAWGAVLGACMHAFVQAAGVYALGYRYAPLLNFADKDVLQSMQQMIPRMLGLAVNQVNYLAMTAIATLLAAGSVTVLQFAYNLNFFPIGVIGVSYAIAAFPTFCELAGGKEEDKLRDAFAATVRQVLFFIIPATVISLLLRAQIVRLVYGAGEFDWNATIVTADTLAMFAVSFFAQCLVFIVIRVYFAFEDTWTPFVVGIVAALVNIVAGYMLAPQFGVPGLAWAFSLASMIQLAMLWVLLKGKLGSLQEKSILRSTVILSVAGVAAAAVTHSMERLVVQYLALDTFVNVLVQTAVAGGAGLFMYFATAFMLKSPEMIAFAQGLHRRLMKSAKPTETVQQELV